MIIFLGKDPESRSERQGEMRQSRQKANMKEFYWDHSYTQEGLNFLKTLRSDKMTLRLFIQRKGCQGICPSPAIAHWLMSKPAKINPFLTPILHLCHPGCTWEQAKKDFIIIHFLQMINLVCIQFKWFVKISEVAG